MIKIDGVWKLPGYYGFLNISKQKFGISQSCNGVIDTVVRAMNQESKQLFSTIQQVKLRQLQLEIEALEKQIEKNFATEPELPLEKPKPAYSLNSEDSINNISNKTPVYSIDTQKTNENIGIKLVSE